MKLFTIAQEPVELYKVLKHESLVSSGGEAKMVIADGLVRVNGETETRKRRKLVCGDIVEFGHEKICVQLQKAGQ